eukprot:scaffold645541_cov15-Prasinocladus_malaysianus.AAC.1
MKLKKSIFGLGMAAWLRSCITLTSYVLELAPICVCFGFSSFNALGKPRFLHLRAATDDFVELCQQ